MLERKILNLINILIDKDDISIKELGLLTGLTRRQIDYNIEKINDIFLANELNPIKIESGRISINKDNNRNNIIKVLLNSLETDNYIFDIDERMRFIFLFLFCFSNDYISLNHLIDALEVGKTTVQSDLKQLESILANSQITISYSRREGYKLRGNEFDIRYYLIKLLIEDLSSETGSVVYELFIKKFNLKNVQDISKDINLILKEFNLNIIEKRVEELSYILTLMIQRLKLPLSDFYDKYNLPMIKKMGEYSFSQKLLAQFNIREDEAILYITAWVLGQTVGDSGELTPDYSIIKELTNRIVERFEAISGIKFENQQAVVHQLYTHLRPTYYRIFFRLPIINPLTEEIRSEYTSLFNIVEETVKPIGGLFGHRMPVDEIAFLTMHFLSLIQDNQEQYVSRKKAVVVCPNGIGSSAIVLSELKSIFPEIKFIGPIETNNLKNYIDNVDIVFSTVQNVRLFMINKPVIVVNPILTTAEKYRVIREVYKEVGNNSFRLPSVDSLFEIINHHTTIKNEELLKKDLYRYLSNSDKINNQESSDEGDNLWEIMPKNLIQLDVKATDWQSAIRKSAEPLLDSNFITINYVNEILKTTKNNGSYMVITKNVALPHAKPSDGVNRFGIGITTLRTPIKFNSGENDPVKYIFFLAPSDNTSHIHALSQLLVLLDNADFYNVMDHAKKPEDILDYIINILN